MPRTETLTGIPAANLAATIRQYEQVGATVQTTDSGDGTFTLIATFPNDSAVADIAVTSGSATTRGAASKRARGGDAGKKA